MKMTSATKVFLTILAAIFFAALLAALSGCAAVHRAAAAPPNVVIAPEGSIPWPAEWAKGYDEQKQLLGEIQRRQQKDAAALQEKIVRYNGWIQWLRDQLQARYPGMAPDEGRRVFVRLPTAPPAAQPAQPAPTAPPPAAAPVAPAPAADSPQPPK